MKDINKDLINIYDDAGNTDYDKKVQGIIHLDDQEADKSIDLVNKENNEQVMIFEKTEVETRKRIARKQLAVKKEDEEKDAILRNGK